jgi:putative tryptophan/tyrosine transport system substrate-binding protein
MASMLGEPGTGPLCSRRALLRTLGRLGLVGAVATTAYGCRAWTTPRSVAPRVDRVGFLGFGQPVIASAHRLAAFRAMLAELGHVEGENLVLDVRHADYQPDRLAPLAGELVARQADVLVAAGTPAIQAALAVTQTLPIVMATSADPVGTGLVASLARPGGNVTGLTDLAIELSGKRLELLAEAARGISRVAVIWNPAAADQVRAWREMERAARALGLQLHSVAVRAADDLAEALEAAVRGGADALTALDDTLLLDRRLLLDLATRHRLPTVYGARECAEAGGLMAYGPSQTDLYRRAAVYVDKILRGTGPAALPVERPTRFELVINLRVARALGLALPASLAGEADVVIS